LNGDEMVNCQIVKNGIQAILFEKVAFESMESNLHYNGITYM